MSLDLDVIFAVLTLGCIIFGLQTLLDYNKRAGKIRPQLREVRRIKQGHKDEIEKIERAVEDAEKEASKHDEELAALEARHDELELRVQELRERVAKDAGGGLEDLRRRD